MRVLKGNPPAGFFAALTYNLENNVIHGLINGLIDNREQTLALKGTFVAADSLAKWKGKIGILIEDHFDPFEFRDFNRFFPSQGYEVV